MTGEKILRLSAGSSVAVAKRALLVPPNFARSTNTSNLEFDKFPVGLKIS